MAILQGQAGGLQTGLKQASGNPNAPQGFMADLLWSAVAPDFYTLLKANVGFFATVTAANPSAFTGGAGGTPLVGIMNPAGSVRDLVVLQVRIGVRTTGTAAVNIDFNAYGGQSALPTGTATVPRNGYSLAQSGSVATAFLNTAMTGSTALSPICPLLSIGTVGSTAVGNAIQAVDQPAGLIIAQPGNLIAIGCSAGPTAASIDCTVYWAELPQ